MEADQPQQDTNSPSVDATCCPTRKRKFHHPQQLEPESTKLCRRVRDSDKAVSNHVTHQRDPFRSLPDKARLLIYRYLFQQKAYHWYWHSRSLAVQHPTWSSFLLPFKYPTALLRTCKAIHHEARATMYDSFVVVCDIRPDRLAGFNLVAAEGRNPRLDTITTLIINLQLDVRYFHEGHRFLRPHDARYPQLRHLPSLSWLGLRVCFEPLEMHTIPQPWYDMLLEAHVSHIVAAVGPTVTVSGVQMWGPLWQRGEMCASLQEEIGGMAGTKPWVDAIIEKVRRQTYSSPYVPPR